MVALDPGLTPEALAAHAYQATRELDEGFAALGQGKIISAWSEGNKSETLKRILKRNLNGIGRTDIRIEEKKDSEIITPAKAEIGLRALEATIGLVEPENDRSRVEIGSIEGTYLQIGHYYAHPAIKIRERKSGTEIWCRISEENLERFSERIKAVDVWRHKRVRARGRIYFDSNGRVLRVEAADVQVIAIPHVTVDEVRDREFTGGLSVSEYLERFREGSLG
jgi:ribosomal protein L19